MNIKTKELFVAYEDLKNLVTKNSYMQPDFFVIQNMFEDKKTKPDANIMVYGVYNAGKSTLINALIGAEVAATGDIPLTDKITAYACRNYMILDTPGIDAPQEHENITKEQLEKADAVIFVVNPLGVVEEAKTLAALMDLFQDGKKVFLVFNEKNQLSEEDFIKLKNQTREKLQELAEERNLQQILKSIPIIKINSQMALIGKLKNKEKLVEFSGYFEFENQLDQFIMSISHEDIYTRLKNSLVDFIIKMIARVESKSNNELVKQYDLLITSLSKDKIELRHSLAKRILLNKNELYSQVKSCIYNEMEDIDIYIKDWILNKSKLIETNLNDSLEIAKLKIQNDIEQLQAKIPVMGLNDLPINMEQIQIDATNKEPHISNDAMPDDGFKIGKEQINLAVSMGKNIKTEHIVAGLNMVKKYLPTLMKGIGKKTIEKWAGQVVGKAMPIASAVVTIGLAVHDIFSDDPETEQLKRQQDIEQKARERREQQIEDSATQIADQFSTSLSVAIDSIIDDFYYQVVDEVKKISVNFEAQYQENSKILEQLQQKLLVIL